MICHNLLTPHRQPLCSLPREIDRIPLPLARQDLDNLLRDGVADLDGAGAAANVLGAKTAVEHVLNGVLDRLGLLGQVEGVAEHHGDGEDGADGVDDALAGDVWRGAWKLSAPEHVTHAAAGEDLPWMGS